MSFDCIEWSTDEDWEKYIASLDDNLLFENIKVVGDRLEIVSVVNNIRSSVLKLLVTKNLPDETCIQLNEIHEKLKFQAFCVETFFNGPELKEHEELDSVKPICVICNTDGSINLANQAYIEATGIKDLADSGELDKYINDIDNQNEPNPEKKLTQDLIKQQKYLQILKILSGQFIEVKLPVYLNEKDSEPTGEFITATISKLFNEIYDEKNNYFIVKNLGLLRDGPGYKRNFTMKTGVTYHWTTLNNNNYPGNIRTAVVYDSKSPIFRQRFDQKEFAFYPFGMYITSYKYNQLVKGILDENDGSNLENEFTKLREMSSIGDTLIDRSNYLVRGFDGKRHYFNREFFKNTPSNIVGKKGDKIILESGGTITLDGGEVIAFSPQLLMQSLIDGTFLERVYGKMDGNNVDGEQIEDIKAHFKSLLKQKSYSYPFSPKNKIGGRNHIEYVTTRYDDQVSREGEGKNTIDLTTLGIFYHDGVFYQRVKNAKNTSDVFDISSKDGEESFQEDFSMKKEANADLDNVLYDPKKDPFVVEYKLKTFGIGKYIQSDDIN